MGWRLGTALAIVSLALQPAIRLLGQSGERAVTHVQWTASGEWRIGLGHRDPVQVVLLNESAIVGSWLFLVWSHEGRRYRALIDTATLRPDLGRPLRVRLRLEAHSANERLQRRLEGRT